MKMLFLILKLKNCTQHINIFLILYFNKKIFRKIDCIKIYILKRMLKT